MIKCIQCSHFIDDPDDPGFRLCGDSYCELSMTMRGKMMDCDRPAIVQQHIIYQSYKEAMGLMESYMIREGKYL